MRSNHSKSLGTPAILIVAAAIVAGCGGDKAAGPTPPTLADAWSDFESGNHASAEVTFHAVIATDSSLADAFNGLGWIHALDHQFDSALHYFSGTLEREAEYMDAWAAISAIWLARGEFVSSFVLAGFVLTIEPEWSFDHLHGVDYLDLHLIMAQAYFAEGEDWYGEALARVKFLDPDCTLSPDDPQTWNGHPTYAAALLKEIEALEAVIGADMLS